MIVNAIYRGSTPVQRVYRNGQIIFQRIADFDFHVVEDGKLIVFGAYSANSLPGGLYLDCAPAWIYPVQSGNVLTVEQVYKATPNGNVLEVE